MVKGAKKTSDKKPREKKMSAKEREELLIENFVGLQKAMTNLSMKFETLSDNISKLLTIFELSAKQYLDKSGGQGDKDLLKKIDSLLEQNKTIAKGLVLIEQKVRSKSNVGLPGFPQMQPRGMPTQNPGQQGRARPKPLYGP